MAVSVMMTFARPPHGECAPLDSKRRAEKRIAFRLSVRPAYYLHAGLSPQSSSGWNVLLQGSTCATVAQTCWRGKFKHCGTLFGRCGATRPSASTPGSSFPTGRWRVIKTAFSKAFPARKPRSPAMTSRGERGIWQRRYWEHTIRDDRDFAAHLGYTHFNPVKHGLVKHPADWPH
jgi:hypothetical protein